MLYKLYRKCPANNYYLFFIILWSIAWIFINCLISKSHIFFNEIFQHAHCRMRRWKLKPTRSCIPTSQMKICLNLSWESLIILHIKTVSFSLFGRYSGWCSAIVPEECYAQCWELLQMAKNNDVDNCFLAKTRL